MAHLSFLPNSIEKKNVSPCNLDDLHNLRVILTAKPMHIYLSESSTDLLTQFCRTVQSLLALNAAVFTPVLTSTNATRQPMCSVDFIYISEIQFDCKTSSKSLLTPVKYLPSMRVGLTMLVIENLRLDRRSVLRDVVSKHYLAELTIKKMIRSNAKNLALVVQLFKAGHALIGIYRYARYRDREITECLGELQDFVIWNLCKAGELGASVFSDLLNVLGRLAFTARL